MNRTVTTSLAAAAATLAFAAAHARAAPVLIDFGNDDSFRGVSTPSPDADGNFWTSVWSGAFYTDLVDADGNATTTDFGFSSAAGTDYFNGPSGATQDPTATVYDDAALGLLGADEALYDYYVSSTFQIQGLDPSFTYDLALFGSHKFNNDDVTRYTAYDDSSFTNPVASVDLTVGVGSAHNTDTVAMLTGLVPDANGILYIGFAGANGGSGYLNAMSVTTVIPEPAAAAVGVAGLGLLLVRRRA